MDAFVHKTARIHANVHIGIGCVIGPNVEIFPGARIGNYTCIGGPPEHKEFFDCDIENTIGVVVGENARIFEFVVIHSGTIAKTSVGSDAAVFAHSLIAHDVVLHEHSVVAGHAAVAGHCVVMPHAFVGARSILHQKTVLGAYSIVGMASSVRGIVPPVRKWVGSPAREAGINDVALARHVMTEEQATAKYKELLESELRRVGWKHS